MIDLISRILMNAKRERHTYFIYLDVDKLMRHKAADDFAFVAVLKKITLIAIINFIQKANKS